MQDTWRGFIGLAFLKIMISFEGSLREPSIVRKKIWMMSIVQKAYRFSKG